LYKKALDQSRRLQWRAHFAVQIQRANMEFFISVGMGLFSHIPAPKRTDFTIVVSGDVCTPCKVLMPLVDPVTDLTAQPQLSAAWSGQARCPSGMRSPHVAAAPSVASASWLLVLPPRPRHPFLDPGRWSFCRSSGQSVASHRVVELWQLACP
jgi:hypothetical protein